MKRRDFLRATGGSGAAVALGSGAAAGQQETGTATGTSSGTGTASGTGTGTGTATGGGGGGGGSGPTEEVIAGPGGSLVFEPETLEITPGTTVRWVWESDNHNVVPESIPEGASWEGTGGDSDIFNTGHEYSFTFETEGTYEYYCAPHKSAGMLGSVSVTPDAGGGGGGGGGGSDLPQVPDSAKSLGVATTFSMIATLGLAYFFMKYGGDYGTEQ